MCSLLVLTRLDLLNRNGPRHVESGLRVSSPWTTSTKPREEDQSLA